MPDPNQNGHETENCHITPKFRGQHKKYICRNLLRIQLLAMMRSRKDNGRYNSHKNK